MISTALKKCLNFMYLCERAGCCVQLAGIGFLLLHVGSEDRTQFIRIVGKHPYPAMHPSGQGNIFWYFSGHKLMPWCRGLPSIPIS